jgi:hypothetical protein
VVVYIYLQAPSILIIEEASYVFVVNILFFHFALYVFFWPVVASNAGIIYLYCTMVLSKYRTAQKCISCTPCEHLIPIIQTVRSIRKCFIVLYSSLFDSRFSIFLEIWPLNQHLSLRNLNKSSFVIFHILDIFTGILGPYFLDPLYIFTCPKPPREVRGKGAQDLLQARTRDELRKY